jgi:hypothetical protein
MRLWARHREPVGDRFEWRLLRRKRAAEKKNEENRRE